MADARVIGEEESIVRQRSFVIDWRTGKSTQGINYATQQQNDIFK